MNITKEDIILFAGLALLFTLTAIFYWFGLGGTYYELITNVLFLLFPFLAVIGGAVASQAYGISNTHGKSLLFITAGIASWFIGEVLFAGYLLVMHIDPYPSVADIFYILAYPLVLIGIIREIGSYKTDISPFTSLIISFLSMAISFFVFYIMIIPSLDNGEPWLYNVISISYGIGDLLLIISISYIMVMIINFKGGRLYHAWLYVLIATLFMLLGDIFFALYSHEYEEGIRLYKQIDLLWIGSYTFYALGLFEMRFIIRDVQKRIMHLLP